MAATDWCTHQVGLAVILVRGPKNPERAAITALAPDHVIANREENRKLDVTPLREMDLATFVIVFGAGSVLVRYLNQGRAEGNRPHLFPCRAARLLLTRAAGPTAGQHDTLADITAACPEMTALASLVRSFDVEVLGHAVGMYGLRHDDYFALDEPHIGGSASTRFTARAA